MRQGSVHEFEVLLSGAVGGETGVSNQAQRSYDLDASATDSPAGQFKGTCRIELRNRLLTAYKPIDVHCHLDAQIEVRSIGIRKLVSTSIVDLEERRIARSVERDVAKVDWESKDLLTSTCK